MKLTDRIGNTQLVELPTTTDNPRVRLLGKMEGQNPGSSVKDRAAWWMIRGAEERGELSPGQTIIEPTSGNTGIALAMIAAARGYSIELVMPASATAERVKTMRAYGATVVLTPSEASMEGAIDFARARVEERGHLMLDQFSNPDNWRAHYESTGPEIWRDTEGRVTHFVSAMGTTGTIMGTSRFLKEQDAGIRIIGCQPTEGSCIPGIRRWPSEYLPAIFEPARVDETRDVDQHEAEAKARELAATTGVFVGASAAGAVLTAQRICREIDSGTVVTVLCDRGERYLSSTLFDGAGALEVI